MKDRVSKMARALRAHGYKLTAQRLAVLEVLQSDDPHLSPAEVYQRGKAFLPGLGLTTVYRTLEVLARLGFLHRWRMGDGAASYSTCTDGHHSHLICSGCGLVVELKECHAHEVAKRLMEETDFRIDSHLLEFLGLCPDCQQANA
jgi:Fur family ferric uptake transcriptional regulator